MKVCLFKFQTKDQGVVQFESWTLPEKGSYPAKDFKTLTYYSFEEDKIDRLNLSVDEFDKIRWIDERGEQIAFDQISEFFAKFSGDTLPVCYFTFNTVTKGRYSVNTLTEILFGQNLVLTA